jgi:hypothetical protein
MRQTTVDPQPWGGEVVEKWQERNERGGRGEGRSRGKNRKREEVVEKGTRGKEKHNNSWKKGNKS